MEYVLYWSKGCPISLECYRTIAKVGLQRYMTLLNVEEVVRKGDRIPSKVRVTPTLFVVNEDNTINMFTGKVVISEVSKLITKIVFLEKYNEQIDSRNDKEKSSEKGSTKQLVNPNSVQAREEVRQVGSKGSEGAIDTSNIEQHLEHKFKQDASRFFSGHQSMENFRGGQDEKIEHLIDHPNLLSKGGSHLRRGQLKSQVSSKGLGLKMDKEGHVIIEDAKDATLIVIPKDE